LSIHTGPETRIDDPEGPDRGKLAFGIAERYIAAGIPQFDGSAAMASHVRGEDSIERAGGAYIRNMAAVEAAVLRGQFNVAKVLRAAAHAQRALALDDARRIYGDVEPSTLLRSIADELRESTTAGHAGVIASSFMGIVERALASLKGNPDILETHVAQSLWGCRICGFIAEGDQPDSCQVCGALAPEFEWFGPFFGGTARIGTLLPRETVNILESIQAGVTDAFERVSESDAGRKPSAAEWSAKETLAHMLETDRLFATRVRFILDSSQSGPIPRPMPPWKLHEGKGYESWPTAELTRLYREVRAETLTLVRGLAESDWAKGKSGTTLTELGTWLAQHEIGHMQQLRRLCGKQLKPEPPKLRTA
jgi:uncharacterized damage-inducible protein DinB